MSGDKCVSCGVSIDLDPDGVWRSVANGSTACNAADWTAPWQYHAPASAALPEATP